MKHLQVYTAEDCWSCQETMRIVEEMREEFPDAAIELLDIDDPSRPEDVFAAPTYVLDGQVISLGNPRRETLRRQLGATEEGETAVT
jgi:hypothetical protein